jgi:hypothetical protein
MIKQQNSIELEEEISVLFQKARINLDKVDEQAKKEKKQIVKDLAEDLEGKIQIDTICIEISNQLHDKVSKRTIRECLDEKYKQHHRVENARKQKERHQGEESNGNLAALMPLNQQRQYAKSSEEIIILHGGQEGSTEEDLKEHHKLSQASYTSITESTVIPNVTSHTQIKDDLKKCPSCIEKDSKNLELSEALSRQTALVTAEVISTHEREFTIPKEKYQNLNDAMQKSRNLVFIIFDKSGVLERVVPDIFREKQTHAS